MEENMTSGVEAEVTDETSLDAAFDEGWNDEDEVSFEQEQPEEDSGEAESGEPAVEEPVGGETSTESPETTEKSAEDPNNQQEPQGQEPPKEEETEVLEYMGEKFPKTKAEMKSLAQMGMDYPRIRQQRDEIKAELDEAKPILDMARRFAAEAGMSLSEYGKWSQRNDLISSGQARNQEEAQRELDRQQREAEIQQWEQQRQWEQERAYQAQARRDADISEFRQTYPDIAEHPDKIPQEVWNAVQNGQTLTSAYSRFAEQQAKADAEAARAELEALKKNNANQAKSTGSMTGSGTPKLGRDPFLEGWDEPD